MDELIITGFFELTKSFDRPFRSIYVVTDVSDTSHSLFKDSASNLSSLLDYGFNSKGICRGERPRRRKEGTGKNQPTFSRVGYGSNFQIHCITLGFINLIKNQIVDHRMSQQAQMQHCRREIELSYHKISIQLRKELIKLVVQQGFSVYRASRLLNINNSTAKAIIRKYRADGTIFIRKSEKFRARPTRFSNNGSSSPENESVPQDQAAILQERPQEDQTMLFWPVLAPQQYFLPYCPFYFMPYS